METDAMDKGDWVGRWHGRLRWSWRKFRFVWEYGRVHYRTDAGSGTVKSWWVPDENQ